MPCISEEKKTSPARRHVVLFLTIGVIIIIGLWSIYNKTTSEINIKNIILISIDTCLADYLSCYGYKDKTTPNIDKLAKKGVRFENVVSPVPLTLPAHSSMFTGTISPYHGVHDNLDYKLDQSNITLAEILKDNGFTSGTTAYDMQRNVILTYVSSIIFR